MIRSTCVLVFIIVTIGIGRAQTGMDKVLSEIEQNNKSLATERQYLESQKLFYKTGLNPENPKIEHDRLPGRPEGAGTQQDFTVTQALDFPTSYGKRRKVSTEQIKKAELEFNAARQQVLLEAKRFSIDFIYRKKWPRNWIKEVDMQTHYLLRSTGKMQQGESSILDVNKVKLFRNMHYYQNKDCMNNICIGAKPTMTIKKFWPMQVMSSC